MVMSDEAQTESNAISNMSFHCNKYQGQKIKFVHTNSEIVKKKKLTHGP